MPAAPRNIYALLEFLQNRFQCRRRPWTRTSAPSHSLDCLISPFLKHSSLRLSSLAREEETRTGLHSKQVAFWSGEIKKKSTREETNIPSKNPDIIREGIGSRGRGGNKFELGGFASLVLLSMLAGKHIILGLYRELAVILLSVRSFFHVAIQV